MPRHRVERAALKRTFWPAGNAAGRVRMLAAGPRPRHPGHARPGTRPGWARLGAGTSRYLRGRRPMLTGAVRGLLVSPWFAAGAGVVVAAGAFVYAPHARLEITTPNKTLPCTVAGCREPLGATAVPAGAGDGKVTAPSAAAQSTHRSVAAGVTVSYYVLWRGGGRFGMVIRVQSKHPIGAWKLTFAIPRSHNLSVYGAKWQPSGPDGGTASGTGGWSNPSAPGADWGGFVWGRQQNNGNGGQPSGDGNAVTFTVQGNGPGAIPDGCAYNGASCRFTALVSAAPGS